ncbi:DUF2971 domain-containing protein [Sulfurimonas sp.]|uniref:DUF2971 domain-containing protein n=1 Tax=Sulfurimonas sp. TaxID=2022749 RepID=UPI00286E4B7A|nr:DUF2971 domain-containing protein [Sulfurimonas sp.]
MSIYKYLSFENAKKIFENQTLRFSNPLSFNDPFELKPNISKLTDSSNHLVINTVSDLLNGSGQAQKFHDGLVSNLSNGIGILCLSAKKDNLLMWAHYAEEHRGIVIEFDQEHEFFYKPKSSKKIGLLFGLEEVNYVDTRPSIESEEWLNKETFFTKGKHWYYEEEYRMVLLLDESNNQNKYNIKFPNQLLKSVYIGVRTSKESIEYIKNLNNKAEWKHLNIFQMEVDEVAYKLKATPYE